MRRFPDIKRTVMYKKRDVIFLIFLMIFLPILIMGIQFVRDYAGRAAIVIPAAITIHADQVTGPLPHTWRALAQGGEEQGVRMLQPVTGQIAEIRPRYVRIDHIYDFYNVVESSTPTTITLNWSQLDQTVCDILASGAKPFFSLGYMPPALSSDGTLIGIPKDWGQWQALVAQTIQRYSGDTDLRCPMAVTETLDDVYYEVWNEPDLETFGKWSIHGGPKDYKTMYYYSAKGAESAQTTKNYYFGGPAITAAYQNWFQLLILYADALDLRMDFLSWHHYGSDVDSFAADMQKLDAWLSDNDFEEYRNLPRVISEWGYDSYPNPIADTNIGAAHTVAAIRYLVEEDLEMAFAFEAKDGIQPSWGILTHDGVAKPRYHALRMLNVLGSIQLAVEGEGSHVKAIASRNPSGISAIVVNYDEENQHSEVVPFTVQGLDPGNYVYTRESLAGTVTTFPLVISETGIYNELIQMPPNEVVSIEITR